MNKNMLGMLEKVLSGVLLGVLTFLVLLLSGCVQFWAIIYEGGI